MFKYKQIYYKIKYNKMIKSNLPIGTKIVVVSDSTSAKIPIGTKLKITDYYNNPATGIYVVYNNTSLYLLLSDVRLCNITIDEINEELELAEKNLNEAKNSVENIKNKINYLTETGNKEFDENEFRAYNTIKTLENSNLSTVEKAKQISSLFN